MANQYVNKVVINGEPKLDLTGDTILANKLLFGFTAHEKSGAPITGTCTFDSDTSDGTVTADEILVGEVAYSQGSKVTGTMANNGSVTGTISTKAQQYTIAQGYHDGAGKVSISTTEQAKLIPGNIKSGITVLGVVGDYSGEGVSAQAKTATPTFSAQTILPDGNYDYLSQVTVNPIPVTYVDNAAGGQTLTVG